MNTPSRRKASTTYKAKLAEAGYRQKAFRFPAEVARRLEARAKAAGMSELKFLASLIMGEPPKAEPSPTPKAAPRKASKPAARPKTPKPAPKAQASAQTAPKRSIVSALNVPLGGRLK